MHSAQWAEGEVSGEALTSTCDNPGFVHGQWKKGRYEKRKRALLLILLSYPL